MKKIKYFSFFICILGCNELPKTNKTDSQSLIEKIELLVLDEKNINQDYKFIINNEHETLEYSITYLGEVDKSKSKILYIGILNGSKISPKFNSYVSVYSQNEKKMGSYYIGSNDKPRLTNDTLIIKGIGNCNQTTRISLRDSIPKQIFINCTTNGGDLYDFITN